MRREIDLEARPENLKVIRDFIEDACRGAEVAASDTHALKLAVDEACNNLVEHGYAGRTGGSPMTVVFEADGEKVEISVTDRGRPFDPALAPEPDLDAGWEERRIGGLGWHLIRKLVDEIRYDSREETGNRLTLVKRRTPRETKPEGGPG